MFLPLYQAEALWINFHPHKPSGHDHQYPFAVKVATGKKSALTGKQWRKGIHKGDYCVTPQQKWLDGYVIEEGVVAQFVAVPLGQGLTVEEQLGGDEVGGIQIEVYPMKAECFERRWPKLPDRPDRVIYYSMAGFALDFAPDMGIGAGGRMKQQVFEDPYGKDEWCMGAIKTTRRCFVHLANSLAWESITDEKPPETPITAAAYEHYGLPWFDYYSDEFQAKKGTKKLKDIKTIKDQAAAKGLKGVLPENQSPKKPLFVVDLKKNARRRVVNPNTLKNYGSRKSRMSLVHVQMGSGLLDPRFPLNG